MSREFVNYIASSREALVLGEASSSEEPGAVVPHAGIWEGGAGQPASLPRYPFGAPLVVIGEEAEENPFRFSTKYTDQETRLLYYGYRYYSPNLGRWLSRDPAEESDTSHLYAFVRNAAQTTVDLLGLESAFNYAWRSLDSVESDITWTRIGYGIMYDNVTSRLRRMFNRVSIVWGVLLPPGASGTYNWLKEQISLIRPTDSRMFDEANVVHELTHAYDHTALGLPFLGWNNGWDREGGAYRAAQILMGLSYLADIERGLGGEIPDCDVKRGTFEFQWRSGWTEIDWQQQTKSYSLFGSRPMTERDHLNYLGNYKLSLSCQKVADILNSKDLGYRPPCCFYFVCGPSIPRWPMGNVRFVRLNWVLPESVRRR